MTVPIADIEVDRLDGDPAAGRRVEVVERKGLGHPDSLCDGVAEAVSRALSRRYREVAGRVLHHNVDKVSLFAGAAEPAFGGGRVTDPVTVVVGGRATRRHRGTEIPVDAVATEAARSYVREVAPALPAGALDVEIRTGETSGDLAAVYDADGAVPLANDTSVGVGYARPSPLERTVRAVEPAVRALEAVGPDVKVMGARRGDRARITVAAAVLDGAVAGPEEYDETLARVREAARSVARERFDGGPSAGGVEVTVNAADEPDAGDRYLTVTGLSAEMGDDGAVGRGNRVNGVIAPARPTSLEAAAGKNPVSHVGKLYNVLAFELSERIAGGGGAYGANDGNDTGGAAAAGRSDVAGAAGAGAYTEIQLLSEIGAPVTEPQAVEVRTAREDAAAVRAAVADGLDRLPSLTDRLVAGDVDVF